MASTESRTAPGLYGVAAILLLGAIAPLLDTTIVFVALDTLARDLDASVSTVQWVSTGYLLAAGMAIPITAWAADRFGAKRMWLLALLLFLAGSLLCAGAWDIGSLIAFRVMQGIGAGLMLPILQTLLLRAAGGRSLGRLMAVVSMPALVGPIFGPVIGGLIAGHASWRWIFIVNVPVCLAAVLLAWWRLPADQAVERRPLDVTGLLLLTPAVVGLIYGLSGLAADPGLLTTWLPLGLGALLLAAFVRHSVTAAKPLLDLRLFTDRGFTASSTLMFLSGLGLYGSMMLLPLYYQQLRGADVITAGLLLAPQGLGSLLSRGLGGVTDRIGPRPVVLLGIALTVVGTLPFAFAGASTPILLLAVALVVRGLGMSGANIAVMVGAFDGLTRAQIPHAATTTRILQQVGGTFGTAVLAVLLEAGQTAGPTAAFEGAFWWATAFSALAVLPALLLPPFRAAVPTRGALPR